MYWIIFYMIGVLVFCFPLFICCYLSCFYSMVSYGMEDFAKKYGAIQPSQFVDVMALVGDRSDNIPGCFQLLF